jgi:tRNA pseudouridine55 synthase
MTIVSVWKRIGETPLQAVERARKEYHLEHINSACFTGRLDPMAQGVMTCLFGDAIKYQDDYNARDKIYRFQAILGISTTSYDAMGTILDISHISHDSAMKFHKNMLLKHGKFIQAFPPYSAMRIKGKPLWWHAKHGSLPAVLPSREREIYKIKEICKPINLSVGAYRRAAISDIKDVQTACNGSDGFDCEKIIKDWRALDKSIEIYRIEYEATVSSGTYIRSLVHDLGHQMGIPAHAARITRWGTCGGTCAPP